MEKQMRSCVLQQGKHTSALTPMVRELVRLAVLVLRNVGARNETCELQAEVICGDVSGLHSDRRSGILGNRIELLDSRGNSCCSCAGKWAYSLS
ncbi:MAG: hypothetical protein EBU46_05745 [Nitrosomonadaceae bacterium]|nr:hypothetical protein [Nitrosomonadaceae bacterium]